MTEILAENRLKWKGATANFVLLQALGVRKPPKTKVPKSDLQIIFMNRLKAELDKLDLNPTRLGRIGQELGMGKHFQRTVADVLNGADPRLETVHNIARTLSQVSGIAAWELFRPEHAESPKIIQLPEPPTIMGESPLGHRNRFTKKKRRK